MKDLTASMNEDQGTIILPDWIGGTSLTLAEIGAIACLACLENGSQSPEFAGRMKSPDMAFAIIALQKKGVLTAKLNGDRITMELNIDHVMPESMK